MKNKANHVYVNVRDYHTADALEGVILAIENDAHNYRKAHDGFACKDQPMLASAHRKIQQLDAKRRRLLGI
tara:strand:+ start:2882 stop:3094 length:213 start_codon:yes stop_codon:yes gene_type:complete